MKIVAVSNQKGGVGKSTFAVHMAFDLRDKGRSVLFVDVDPQANSSKTLAEYGVDVSASELFLRKTSPSDFPVRDGITLIGADPALTDIERAEPAVIKAFQVNLRDLSEQYDYCIIDTPPTLGLRMSAAIMSADFVLSPIELEQYSLDGIQKMLQTIFGIKQKYNNDLVFLGMLPNRFNPRSKDQKATFLELVKSHADLIIQAKIGIRSSIPEALSEHKPVWEIKKTAAREAAKEFRAALEIIYEKMEAA